MFALCRSGRGGPERGLAGARRRNDEDGLILYRNKRGRILPKESELS